MKTIRSLRDALKAQLTEKAHGLASQVAAGQCGDFAEYKGLVGRIRGYTEAIDDIDEVFNKLLDEEAMCTYGY